MIIILELILLIFIIRNYRNDLKTIAKEDLAVPLKDRIFAQIALIPVWALDILIIIEFIIIPALSAK